MPTASVMSAKRGPAGTKLLRVKPVYVNDEEGDFVNDYEGTISKPQDIVLPRSWELCSMWEMTAIRVTALAFLWPKTMFMTVWWWWTWWILELPGAEKCSERWKITLKTGGTGGRKNTRLYRENGNPIQNEV